MSACYRRGVNPRPTALPLGLAFALLDARERDLQEAVLRGAPPLGPGAPPEERARAFLAAVATFALDHAELLAAVPRGRGTRFEHPVHAWRHAHLRAQLAAARPDADADGIASALLAALGAEHLLHLHGRGFDRARIERLARDLV